MKTERRNDAGTHTKIVQASQTDRHCVYNCETSRRSISSWYWYVSPYLQEQSWSKDKLIIKRKLSATMQNWAVYRQGQAKFSPQNINPIYDTIAPFDKYQDLEKRGLSHFASLKTYNKELKTMVAIGGWNEASKKFSPMVADPERRYTFIKSAVQFLRRYNFDGIDLDWEYPTQRDGGRPQDKENYAKLIKEMREAFEREADQTGKDRLNHIYGSYDYHSSLETAVNHHSPLFRIKEISEFDFRTDLNIESTIKYYLGHGASPNKLVLGIPTYGRSYTLVNPDAHEIGSPTDGPGVKGNGTKEDGYLAYYEICKGIKEQKMGCSAKRALYSSTTSVQSSRSDRPRSLSNSRGVTTPSPPTTPSSEPSFVCTDEGFFPHTKSCKKYYWCLEAAGVGMVAHTFTCPQGLFFNSLTDGCDFKRNVECGDKKYKGGSEGRRHNHRIKRCVKSQMISPFRIFCRKLNQQVVLQLLRNNYRKKNLKKKELKQRTKDRNDDISSKTRNRFTKLLERKKPKESESTSSESSYSQEKKRTHTSSPIITESPSTTPITSSPISNPPARSGFLRNRNRPTFLRNQPPQPEENVPAEDNEIVLPETPRNSLVQDPLKNVQRTSFLNRGTPPQSENISGLGKAEPEEEEELEVIKIDDQTPDLITEGTPTLLQRSRDSESRNLAYVTIDRSRGTPKLSDDTEPVIPSQGRESAAPSTTLVEEEAPRDRENTVRDLEYVTIQRGVPSRKKLQSQVGFGISNEISNRGTKHPRGRRSVSSASETVSLVFPSSPFIDLIPPSSNNDNVKYVYPNYIRTNRQVTSSSNSTSPAVDPAAIDSHSKDAVDDETKKNNNENQDDGPSTTTLLPTTTFTSEVTPKSLTENSIQVHSAKLSSSKYLKDHKTMGGTTETVDDPLFSTTAFSPSTTIELTTTKTPHPSTTISTTTSINKIQALIYQRKNSGKNSFFLNKSRKEFESANEISDSKSSSSASSSPLPSNSIKIPSFKRPNLRAKFPRKPFGKKDLTPSTTQQSSSLIPDTTTFKPPSTTTTERNGFVKPSRPTNRLFNKFISRGTIGKLSKEDKTSSTSVSDNITTTTSKTLVSAPVTRSTLRSFIPTRSFSRRPSSAFKPIDLSAAPSKKSISQDRSSSFRRSNLFTETTTDPTTITTYLPVIVETTEKLTVGKILANLHGDSTENPESSSLRPKSFKPKFQRNKLREKLQHQLQEQQESINFSTEEPETTTNTPQSSLSAVKIKSKITPRRILSRPGSKPSKPPRDFTTQKPNPSTPSRFQPTPRRNLRNRFSPTITGFSRNNERKNLFSSQLPRFLSTTTESTFIVTEPAVRVISNGDIAQKLGLIPTPIPLSVGGRDDDSTNIIDSTQINPLNKKDILVGLFNSQSSTKSPSFAPTERNTVKNLLESAIVSSSIPKQKVESSTERYVPFFPNALPLREPISDEDDISNAREEDLANNFVKPISRSSTSFASRRQNKRGRKIKRRRNPFSFFHPSRNVPKRQFGRRPNFSRQKNIRNRLTSERETTTFAPESSESVVEQGEEPNNQVSLNEVEPQFRRRRPDFQRRRNNIGKLSIKNITDTGRDSDFDLDNNNLINKTTTTDTTLSIINKNEEAFTTKGIVTTVILLKNDSNLNFQTTVSNTIVNVTTPIQATTSTLRSRTTPTIRVSSPSTTLSGVKKAKSKERKNIFNRRRKPSKFAGFRQDSNKDNVELSVLGETTITTSFPNIIETNTPLSDIEPLATTNIFDENVNFPRIEKRSTTISNPINEIDSTTESFTLSSVSEHSFTTDGDVFQASSRTTAQPSSSTTLPTKKSLLFSRNRSTFFKSRFSPPKSKRKQFNKLGDIDGKSSLTTEVVTLGPSSTTSIPTNTKRQRGIPRPSIVTTPATPRRSIFNSAFKRPKLPFFQNRKNSPTNTKDIVEFQSLNTLVTEAGVSTTVRTTASSSSSTENIESSSRSTSPNPNTSTSAPSTSPIIQNAIKTSSSVRESERHSKTRFPFKFSPRNEKSPIKTFFSRLPQNVEKVPSSSFSELDNSINTDIKVIDRKPLDDEESVEDAGSLQGRLLQTSSTTFIRPHKPVTTESSVLTPTITNTPEEEKIIINDEHVFITTNTVATTETVTTQSASTSRPHQKLRPINLSSPSSVNEVDPLQNEFETSSTKSFFNPTSPSRNRFRPQVNQSPAPNTSPLSYKESISASRYLYHHGENYNPKVNSQLLTPQILPQHKILVINEDQPSSSGLSTPFQNRIQLQNQSPAHKPSTHIPSRVQLQDQSPKHRSATTFAFENRKKLQEQSLDSNDSPSPKDNKPVIRGQFPALRPSTPSPSQNRFQIEDQSPEPTPTPSLEEIKSLNPDQSPIPTPSTPTPLQNNFLPQDQSPAPRLSTPSPIILQPEDQSPNNPNISLSRSRLQLQLQSPDAPETSPSRGRFQPHEQFFDTPEPSPSPLNNRFRQVEQSSDRPANTQYPTRSRFQPQGQSPDTPETSRYPSRSRFQPQEQSLEIPPTSPSPLKSRFQPLEQSSDTPETSSSGSLFPEQSTDLPTTSTSTVRNVFQPQEQSSDEPETPSLRSRLKPQEQSIDTSSTPPSPSNNRFQSHEQSSDTPKTSPSGNGLPSQEQPQDSPKTSFSRNRFQSRNRSPDSSLSRNRFQSRNRSPKVPEISPTTLPQEARTNIFQQQPRRLDVFRNRFQVSPSSPRPIVSKSKEEELFSDVQQQQNTLPISDDKESSQSNSDFPRDSITTASTTTDPPARSNPSIYKNNPFCNYFKAKIHSASRSRSKSINRSRTRSRPTTTTTTPAPEYDYYYDEEYPGEKNGIGKLKSVDPIYDYDLTPLTEKVAITSEGVVCYDVGVFPHPGSCKKFITCSRRTSVGRIVGWEYECPIYLAFDSIGGRCNWASEVDCS
ncbi:E3.2.1.14 [Lepeophtheirus salmonis]|uniref:E3.2.1.14 n=1 Tax=Lepeophtheirus salmonis TaxID=72036 RepID=A0A7R8CBY2_LEPSM|nr:E3.2.1.14 [Lepeophtheirus salmonis]CAF2760648.1 E3.2.1.14 [Lepeophtheirus salmonis]